MCRFWEPTAAIFGATDGTAAFWKKCALVKSLVASLFLVLSCDSSQACKFRPVETPRFGVWGCVNSTSVYESIPISFLVYTDLIPIDLSACVWCLHTWKRILLPFLISNMSWVLADIMRSPVASGNAFRNSGHRLCIMFCPRFWADYWKLIAIHCQELTKSHGR